MKDRKRVKLFLFDERLYFFLNNAQKRETPFFTWCPHQNCNNFNLLNPSKLVLVCKDNEICGFYLFILLNLAQIVPISTNSCFQSMKILLKLGNWVFPKKGLGVKWTRPDSGRIWPVKMNIEPFKCIAFLFLMALKKPSKMICNVLASWWVLESQKSIQMLKCIRFIATDHLCLGHWGQEIPVKVDANMIGRQNSRSF